MSCNNLGYTITFDEKVTGWTSFHSFAPDYMIGMNNTMFSFKNGDLYVHNSDEVGRNVYYGESFPSKVSLMFNDNSSEIKELKAISLEGNKSWNLKATAFVRDKYDFTESNVQDTEFSLKEGLWYAYARRNENDNQLDSKSTYGIGVVEGNTDEGLVVSGSSDLMSINDVIVTENQITVGGIKTYKKEGGKTIITFASVMGVNIPVGTYVFGRKNSRVEGGNLRGYTIKLDLENNGREPVELFAVNAEVMKSFP